MTNKQAAFHANRIINALHRVEHLMYTAMNFESDSANPDYDWDAEWPELTDDLDNIGKEAICRLEEIERGIQP